MAVGMIESGQKMENSIDFAPFLKALKKNWWKILLFTVVVTGACFPLISKMTSKYVSTSTVLLKAQEDNATPIENVDGYDSTRSPYYITQVNLMESRVVLEKAIKDLKLDDDPRYNGGVTVNDNLRELPLTAVDRMKTTLKNIRKNLSISEVRLTQLVHVSFEADDAEEAARIADGIAQAFIDYTVDNKIEKVKAAQQWNEEQMEDLRKQVANKKKEMEQFLNKEDLITFKGIDGFETQQLSIMTERLANATERRMLAQSQYELVVQNLDAPLEDLASIPEISSHPQLQDLRIAMIQAKRTLFDLQNRYGPKHNKILEAEAQIKAIELQFRRLLVELKLGLYKEYQAQLAKENRYKALLNEQKNGFKSMVAKRDTYESMQTDLQKTEELYKEMFLRNKEQELSSTYREPDAILYDPASVARTPAKPNKVLLLVMVFIMSFALSTLYVIIRAAMDQKIYNLTHVLKKLGLRPLADIPEMDLAEDRNELVNLIRSNQYAMESFHGIKTAIQLSSPTAYVLGVVASTENEGSTLVSQLLADSLSCNHRTLLLDLDFRSASGLSLMPEFMPQTDVANSRATEANGAVQWDAEGADEDNKQLMIAVNDKLDFLPRGMLEQSPLIYFSSEQFIHMMQELPDIYERIVVNLPSLTDNKDTQLIAKTLDGVVVVMQAALRSVPVIRQDLQKLNQPNITTIGAVLNRVQADNLQSEESKQFIAQGSFSALLAEE
uniref:Polysaccharide biosynthesis tyrosine autokinase n=2 Tax=Vibrio ziniensis TaxID=2711221 RepID=A0A6G7CQ35_9VIBR|nr:polysaccharide biosynthesis tyrosine autokinase [Vibrio ziniensis]